MRGVINHIAINVSDREVSNLFYTPILEWLGYEVEEELDELTVWVHKGSGTAINIWDTKEEHKKSEFNRHAIGLNHIAFNAKTAKEVDEFYELLQSIEAEILDPPAHYDEYEKGYYAVFATDPDGVKIEFTYTPSMYAKKGEENTEEIT